MWRERREPGNGPSGSPAQGGRQRVRGLRGDREERPRGEGREGKRKELNSTNTKTVGGSGRQTKMNENKAKVMERVNN